MHPCYFVGRLDSGRIQKQRQHSFAMAHWRWSKIRQHWQASPELTQLTRCDVIHGVRVINALAEFWSHRRLFRSFLGALACKQQAKAKGDVGNVEKGSRTQPEMFAEKEPPTRGYSRPRITNMTMPFESEQVYRSVYNLNAEVEPSRRAPLVPTYPMRPICKIKE